MTLIFIQGHNCISNSTDGYWYYNSNISDTIKAMAFKLFMTVGLWIAYMLMLDWMTLTLVQGHSELKEENIQRWIISTTKQAKSIQISATVGHDKFY